MQAQERASIITLHFTGKETKALRGSKTCPRASKKLGGRAGPYLGLANIKSQEAGRSPSYKYNPGCPLCATCSTTPSRPGVRDGFLICTKFEKHDSSVLYTLLARTKHLCWILPGQSVGQRERELRGFWKKSRRHILPAPVTSLLQSQTGHRSGRSVPT